MPKAVIVITITGWLKVTDWQEVVQEAKKLGFEWSGDWTSFKDYSQFQMVFGLTLTQLRAGGIY
jgi:peptidoglycan L-alanyl-D-glutamate endopeptidase CwlK